MKYHWRISAQERARTRLGLISDLTLDQGAALAHIMIHRQTLLHRHIHGLLQPIFEFLHKGTGI